MASDASRLQAAYARYGRTVDSIAQRYVNPITGTRLSGASLLAKLVQGESGGRRDAVSSAGARAWAQFVPSSRAIAIQKYGVDPWRSPDEAVHAASLHLRGKINGSTGLEGFNPGDPTYPAYILSQKVGAPTRATGGQAQASAVAQANGQGGYQPGQLSALLQAAVPRSAPPPVSSPTAPQFAAAAALPAGYTGSPSAGAPQPTEDSLAQRLAAIDQLGQQQDQNGASPSIAPSSPQATDALTSIIKEANRIDVAKVPYKWGGGHGAKQIRGSKVTPLDCSGALSRVLGIDPRVAKQFESFGQAGEGKSVSIYANQGHTLMKVRFPNGSWHFWGTSSDNAGGGAGWIKQSAISDEYLKRFTVRHPVGL